MVTFVLLEGLTLGKAEWKFTALEHGVLLLTLIGPMMMHKLSVAQWDTLKLVRYKHTKHTHITSSRRQGRI